MDAIDAAYCRVVSAWHERHITSGGQLASVLVDYRVRFAYDLGSIENPELTYHDTCDVFEDGRVRGFSGDPRTIFEIQNLKNCHELMLDVFDKRRPEELMNYLLLLRNHPPIILFETDRMGYYGAIETWDVERDFEPMKTFFKAEAIRTWAMGG